MPQIIQTSQAPDAKPIGLSFTLLNSWSPIIEVPSYEVPQQSFGGGTDVVPGVAEIISPLLACNKTSSTATISVRIFRASSNNYFTVANELPVASNDILPIPLNGQFIYTEDILEVRSNIDSAIDITLSYTVGQAETDDVA
jgi:hypothetical protein